MKDSATFSESNMAIFNYSDSAETAADKVVEETIVLEGDGKAPAESKFYRLSFRNIYFCHYNTSLQASNHCCLGNSKEFVQLHFSFCGNSRYKTGHSVKPFALFTPQEHNMLYFSGERIYKESEPDEQLEVIEINLAIPFFMRYLPNTNPLFISFQEKVLRDSPARMSPHNLPITPKMTAILQEMLHCRQKTCYKRLFFEAKIIELLALQFEQCEQVQNGLEPQRLKRADIEKMHHAREVLINNLQNPYSLIDLAHLVGTNEYYLKKHFKQVFGNTVFGYLHTYRMEQAKKALQQQEKKISEIAQDLGYKYTGHFTTAYKKYFGFLPHKPKPQP